MMNDQKVLLIGLSDPLSSPHSAYAMRDALRSCGVEVDLAQSVLRECTPQEKADEFNQALRSQKYSWIFDLTGGNLANLTLPYIDYAAYRDSRSWYAAFSDGTCIVNALSTCSQKRALLYGLWQQSSILQTLSLIETGRMSPEILPINDAYFPRHARVYGGNIRCLLKLAQTGRMPDPADSLLVLESASAGWYLFQSMAAHLAQIGMFDHIDGIILGRFNRLEMEMGSVQEAVREMVNFLSPICPPDMPFFFAPRLGHLDNAQGIWISPGTFPSFIHSSKSKDHTDHIEEQNTVSEMGEEAEDAQICKADEADEEERLKQNDLSEENRTRQNVLAALRVQYDQFQVRDLMISEKELFEVS